MENARTTLHDVVDLNDAEQRRVRRNRRVGYAATSVVLATVMGIAVLDGFDVVDALGVDDDRVAATADGTTLEVRYPTVSRPALASPFEITVRRPEGFQGQQIDVTVTTDYLALWDLNGIFPAPAEETADDEEVTWTFDPPDGEVFRVIYEARIEPAAQNGERGRVAVLDASGEDQVVVEFETQLRP